MLTRRGIKAVCLLTSISPAKLRAELESKPFSVPRISIRKCTISDTRNHFNKYNASFYVLSLLPSPSPPSSVLIISRYPGSWE